MPRGTLKTHFSGFNFTLLARRQSNATRRSLTRSSAFLVFHDYVVYVSLNGSPDVVSEDVLHTSLVCSARVSEAKRHRHVAEHSERRDERSRKLVGLLHLYLVVPGMGIKETQKFTPCS
jgi:hypothetical protein